MAKVNETCSSTDVCPERMHRCTSSAIFSWLSFSTMSATYLQATDHILPSIFIQLCRQFAVLLPLMAALNALLQMQGIWIAFPAAEIFTAVLAAGLYARCKAHPAG